MTLKELVAEFKNHDSEFLEQLRDELDELIINTKDEEDEE